MHVSCTTRTLPQHAGVERAAAHGRVKRGLYGFDWALGIGSGTVMLAHDTRPSAAELIQAAAAGVTALGSIPVACGLLTTPQLHWMVHSSHGLVLRRADSVPWVSEREC